MALSIKQLVAAQQLTASAATYYTVPAATVTRVTEVLAANNDTVDRTLSLHFVMSGGSATNANRFFPAVNIPAGQLIKFKLDTVLKAGDFIAMLASAAAVMTTMVSGAEIA